MFESRVILELAHTNIKLYHLNKASPANYASYIPEKLITKPGIPVPYL